MKSEALGPTEALPAQVAAVRPLPGVQPEVVLETRRPGETLVALGTVKLLPKVNFLMFPQAARLVKAPLA